MGYWLENWLVATLISEENSEESAQISWRWDERKAAGRQGGKAVGQIKRGAIDIDREQTGTLNIRHTLRTSNGCLAMATASDCSQEMSDIFYPKNWCYRKHEKAPGMIWRVLISLRCITSKRTVNNIQRRTWLFWPSYIRKETSNYIHQKYM